MHCTLQDSLYSKMAVISEVFYIDVKRPIRPSVMILDSSILAAYTPVLQRPPVDVADAYQPQSCRAGK